MKNQLKEFVRLIVDEICELKKGQKVYLKIIGHAETFEKEFLEAIRSRKVEVHVVNETLESVLEVLENLNEEELLCRLEKEITRIKSSDFFLTLIAEEFNIPSEYSSAFAIYSKVYKKGIRDARLKYCKWLSFRLPNVKMAELTDMSFEQFTDYYYKACCIDYKEMKQKAEKLASLIASAGKVRIIAPNVDIFFEKHNIGTRILAGEINMPDGEIYTAPIKESVNGVVKFNIPSIKEGYKYKDIFLRFECGKVIDFNANNKSGFGRIINLDSGARYVGEFAVGINPFIEKSTGLTIFDEKILGTVHFALGQSYKDTYNGNDSALHWDLVLDLRKKYGGGKIFFDDLLVFEDGIWKI